MQDTPNDTPAPDSKSQTDTDDHLEHMTAEELDAEIEKEIAALREPVESRSTTEPGVIRSFALECARLLEADKCEHIVLLDVRGRSQVAEFVIVGSGTSDRQMNSAIDDAVELGERYGFPAMRTNRDTRSTWLLADFVDVIAHLFEPNTRAYYDIETLWGDAPRIDWKSEVESNGDGETGPRP